MWYLCIIKLYYNFVVFLFLSFNYFRNDKDLNFMTSYEGFPGHEEIREFLELQETDIEKSVNSSITSASSPSTSTTTSEAVPGSTSTSNGPHDSPKSFSLNYSSSSADNIPCAPPCSLSGSSENLTPNMDSTGTGSHNY